MVEEFYPDVDEMYEEREQYLPEHVPPRPLRIPPKRKPGDCAHPGCNAWAMKVKKSRYCSAHGGLAD